MLSEKLWNGGGTKYKKKTYSCKGKFLEKNFEHQVNLKIIHVMV